MPTAAVTGLIWAQVASLYGDLRERQIDPTVHTVERRSTLNVRVLESEQLRLPGQSDPAGVRLTEPSAVHHSDGRTYLALKRTPLNRDSTERVVVFSSRNQRSWRTEVVLSADQQTKTPTLVSHNNRLLLFSSIGPDGSRHLQPTIALSEKVNNIWKPARVLPLKGHRLLSVQRLADQLIMTTFKTPMSSARSGKGRNRLRAHTSPDGLEWRTLSDSDLPPDKPEQRGAAFAAGDDGSLFAVTHRASDTLGQQTFNLCVSPHASWTEWNCEQDPLRLNNAKLFTHKNHILLLGQRDVELTVPVDWLPKALLTVQSMLETETATKRCSVFRYNTKRRKLEFLLDLPSRGDNCSPSTLPAQGTTDALDALHVIDYSSEVTAGDVPLHIAQRGPTWIYRYRLRLDRSRPARAHRQATAPQRSAPKGAQVSQSRTLRAAPTAHRPGPEP